MDDDINGNSLRGLLVVVFLFCAFVGWFMLTQRTRHLDSNQVCAWYGDTSRECRDARGIK